MRLNHRDDQPYDVGVVATEHYKIRRHVLGQSSIIETCSVTPPPPAGTSMIRFFRIISARLRQLCQSLPDCGAHGCDGHHKMSDLGVACEPANSATESGEPMWPHRHRSTCVPEQRKQNHWRRS
jgi:hypothetical protein